MRKTIRDLGFEICICVLPLDYLHSYVKIEADYIYNEIRAACIDFLYLVSWTVLIYLKDKDLLRMM